MPTSVPYRPALVVKLRGIILQSDKTSVAGAWIIRPVEMLDLHLAGLGRSREAPPLAMHAGRKLEKRRLISVFLLYRWLAFRLLLLGRTIDELEVGHRG